MYTEIIIKKKDLKQSIYFKKKISTFRSQTPSSLLAVSTLMIIQRSSHSGKLIFDGHRRNLGKVREPEQVDGPPEGVGVGAGEEIEFRIS